MKCIGLKRLLLGAVMALVTHGSIAHHVLGRPSYSLNESSNTPSSIQVETRIGKYYVTYMVFPAFPKPHEQGRVNLYVKRIKDGKPFEGKVVFKIRNDSWFSSKEEVLGSQKADDAVFRQGFVFRKAGNYLVRAQFFSDNEPYTIDFPLRIGNPWPIGPVGFIVGFIVFLLILVNVKIRRRLKLIQTVRHRDESRDPDNSHEKHV